MMLQTPDVGEMLLHHTADAWTIDVLGYPGWTINLPRWPDVHIGAVTLNLSPTKHVVFLIVAAVLVYVTMWYTGRVMARQSEGSGVPKGIAGAVEGIALWVREDIALANIGHDGKKFVPLILTLFFFVLYCNLLGLMPGGATPTGNLAVTAALAIMVFLVIEIGGMLKLGVKGYLHTIFPPVPGMTGASGVAMSIAMAPIEILSKLVKPFALAIRLFGNMTAGHFVILSLFGIIFLFGTLGGWSWAIGLATAALVTGIMVLELIVALLQAYVFALLSAVFIGLMQHEH